MAPMATRLQISQAGAYVVEAVRHGDCPPHGYEYEVVKDGRVMASFGTLFDLVLFLQVQLLW